jgi:hypothetical protein
VPDTTAGAPEPDVDADALCAHAAFCWDRAFRGYAITDVQKSALVRDGLKAVSRALMLAPTRRALTYKVLLLRLQAALEPNPAERAALELEADARRQSAVDAHKIELIPRATS